MSAPPASKGRGGHNQPDLIVVKSKVVGVASCEVLSLNGEESIFVVRMYEVVKQ